MPLCVLCSGPADGDAEKVHTSQDELIKRGRFDGRRCAMQSSVLFHSVMKESRSFEVRVLCEPRLGRRVWPVLEGDLGKTNLCARPRGGTRGWRDGKDKAVRARDRGDIERRTKREFLDRLLRGSILI